MKLLLVSSGGGHLAHLWALRSWWQTRERHWVVLDTPEARERLRNESVTWVRGPTNRSIRHLGRQLLRFPSILGRHRPDRVITAGAALAVPAVLWASRLGIRCHYIEVVDRVAEPSLSARLCRPMARVGVHWPCQARALPGATVLGPLWGGAGPRRAPREDGDGVFVTVGTHHQPFDRLVRVAETLASQGHRVVVQRGASTLSPAGCEVYDWLSPERWQHEVEAAAVTITHAGPASIQAVVQAGGTPIVVPRHPLWKEHIDHHQLRFAAHIEDRVHVVMVPQRLPEALAQHAERCRALPVGWQTDGETAFVQRVAAWVEAPT